LFYAFGLCFWGSGFISTATAGGAAKIVLAFSYFEFGNPNIRKKEMI
jgi:hypothetical protein